MWAFAMHYSVAVKNVSKKWSGCKPAQVLDKWFKAFVVGLPQPRLSQKLFPARILRANLFKRFKTRCFQVCSMGGAYYNMA
ncbi:TPA: hypothetical protein HA244_06905 [Candidatus Micrarchaeota archaeon]|nr:hypothetical protein [Candidatus Micrarchaeota archaeon]